jgi:VWFA-related protein
MKFRFIVLLIFTLIFAPLLPVLGQSQSRPNTQNDQAIRIGTAEVALDVVVRDKKGRPVRDLAASDFEVYEDGERQRIESFRLVLREAKATGETVSKETAAPAPVAAAKRAAAGEASVIALVFDRLRPEARILARRAALAYAEEGLSPADFTGVFLVDLSLRTMQPYTDQPQLVSQAIDRATTLATSTFVSNTEQTRTLANRSASLEQQATSAASQAGAAGGGRDSSGASAAGGAAGAAAVDQMFAQMNSRMLNTFEMLERNQQGYATIYALLAVVDSMRNLPGRKSIIFFSEGLAIPPAVQARFRSVVNAANRAQVSIYPIDAAGLRTESGTAETARELNSIAGGRMRQAHSSREDTTGPMSRQLERNEDLLRLNPETSLGQLADQTGGFLINNTNNLTAGLRRIDEDMRVHYAMSYVPQRQEYDGRFRKITVKLKRSELDVQTRQGYYAIDPASTVPVLDYEVPALAILNTKRTANTFPLRVGGLHFPETNRLGLTPVLVEVPLTAFTFAADKEKKTYATDFSIVALVKDESKQVVQKLSQHYALSGPLDKLEAARKGEVIFYREAELPPGRYTIEAAAFDAPTSKASVRTVTLEVPEADETNLRMSNILLLKRADRLTAEELKQPHPFHFGEVIVYPNLGEALHKAVTKQLAFFVTVWPSKAVAAPPSLVIEVRQQERVLGQTKAALPAADAAGRIQYASALPLDNFQPGSYELRLTVQDGQRSVSRATPFTLEP